MRSVPPMPSKGDPPPAPPRASEEALARSLYETPALPASAGRFGEISLSPQETAQRRQGSQDSLGRRSGTVRTEGGGWIYAPSTSHISRFMFGPKPGGGGWLQVIFKGPNNSGEVAEYGYDFRDYDQGLEIFDDLRTSPHPYGEVLYPDVIQAGIPAHPLARA